MTSDTSIAATEVDIEYAVYTMWEDGKTISEICNILCMTENELCQNSAIDELFNKGKTI